MKKIGKIVLLALAVLLLIAQFLPIPPAENPPVGAEVPAPADVMAILETSCYDCHSNQTVWPWYSHVIPSKWFVRRHVVEGRSNLNFSAWDAYTPERAAHKMEEVVEMVGEGKMPLPSYLWLHGNAALTQAQADRLVEWAKAMGGEDEAGGE